MIAFCISLSVISPVFAEETDIIVPSEEIAETVTEDESAKAEIGYDEKETYEESICEEDINEPEEIEPETIKMFLCATAHSFTGHVWLYFENHTSEDLPLGYATLKSGASMTAGSLRNTRKNHGGTYYNGEAFMVKDPEKLQKHTTSIEMDITKEQLEKVSEEIKSRNLYILIGWNCGNFACKVWNSVSDKHIVHFVFPAFTILSMLIHGAIKGEVLLKKPDISEVFKQNKDGIIQADEKSFRISCIG